MAHWRGSGWAPPFGYGYSHPSPFQYGYPTDPNEALEEIDRIESTAEYVTNSRQCFELYERALYISTKHDFMRRAAMIHCKQAKLAFKNGNLSRAMKEADYSIEKDSDYLEGYHWSAVARHHSWHTGTTNAQMCAARAVQDFVTEYCKASQREKKTVLLDLCTAIKLAVDSRNTSILKLSSFLTREECTAMVTELLSLKTCYGNHLQYVIMKTDMAGSGIVMDLKSDLSKLKTSKIFEKKGIEISTIEAVLKLGASIKPKSIEKAIKHIYDDQVPILEFALTACEPRLDGETLTSFCNQALSLNKPTLSAFLISKGAKPDNERVIKSINTREPRESLVSYLLPTPDGCACLLMHSINNSAPALTKRCLDGCTSIFNLAIDLGSFLKSSEGLLCQNPDLFEELLKVGVNPDGLSDSNRPIDALLALPSGFEHKSTLICMLANHGADLTKATYPRTEGTNIFHIGTEMAIQQKDIQILETVCNCYQFPEDFDTKIHATNKRGQTPYHLVMQQKQNDLSIKICEILSKCPIDPYLLDSRRQRPADFKHPKFKSDKRVPILMEAAKNFQAKQSRRKTKSSPKSKSTARKARGKSKQKGTPSDGSNEFNVEEDTEDSTLPSENRISAEPSNTGLPSKSGSVIEDPNLRALKEFMDLLSKQSADYFAISTSYTRQSSSHKAKCLPPESEPTPIHQVDSPVQLSIEKKVVKKDIDKGEEDIGINKDNILANFDDESLKWEVEFPENIVKYFKTMSNDEILCLAIRKIQRLALGIPTNNKRLCKRVGAHMEIYETRVTQAIRILWEVATQFSPTLTSKLRNSDLPNAINGNCYLYSEVIRIWDIVEDHDNLQRSIDLAVERIKSCRKRGEQATTKVPLLLSSDGDNVSIGHSGDTRYPRVFTDRQLDPETTKFIAQQVYCYPAGSAKDDEYNVITFYPFDLTFVKSILEGEDARRDFPYKEWPKEHDIINMDSRSILLLGRSGTGKTTCCLYRLWNCFKNYWSKANDAGPWFPARPLILYDTSPKKINEESDSEDEILVSQTNPSTSESQSDEYRSVKSEADNSNSLATVECADESELESTTDLEHLHQIFITKNYVLCAQMKKRFYDLAAGNDVAKEHMPFEDAEQPASLAQVDDLAYPLFLTAREFFLLLDNSIDDESEFFTRTSDGKLTEKIRSSDYDHEDPDTLLDLDWESDQEEGSDSESSDDEATNQQTEAKSKQPQRREVTASYFVEKIWPNIHHVCEDKKTDPLLIWMEIKSFIKGSREAVESEKGYLTSEEYEKLGAKMAANFAGSRQEVYRVFEKYQHFIRHRADERLFDECEFIHNLFGRLCKLKEVPFSIHRFYVDEVQDFTQAELSILLRCCKDPNNLFLTGDTAQSIMRGVSFRFSDLRSLFYKANKQAINIQKKAKVTVPKVDKLTINFRSHSGVLKLAASVVDVLQKFFPTSFDCLPGDEGMFLGPIPTLLDSCNFSDLALVLRGNKRESSAIEFGAHQVIIVQSEDAKRAIPSELQAGIVLTIFEAKGLEFDDVLLYDFFKDSKVSKEWRIVTEFIESSPELLASEDSNNGFENKPRPLKFDEQHHKSLSAELKYLYTAITRAKCNLWIYDSDEKNRLPMFDYWSRRGLVKIICLSKISQQDESSLFAATSTKEEWKKQGDYFKKKKLWEPAMKCYVKAEETYLEMEAKAYSLFQKARSPNLKPREMEELYLQAALAFLECNRSKHDLRSLRHAASFLKKAKKPDEAGFLYAKLNRHKDAVKEFKKSKNFQGLVRLKEQEGNYNDAVSLLVANGRKEKALDCAERYENEGQTLRSDLQASVLAIRFAKEICQQALTQGSRSRLAKLVKFMNNPMDRVYYLRIARKYRDVFNILCNEKRFDEAYRICAAQGWVDDGLKLAEEEKNEKQKQQFTFQKAIAGLVEDDRVDVDTVTRLHSLKKSKYDQIKAKACLLLGKSDDDFFHCRRAFDLYTHSHNAAGCIEAFNLMVKFRSKGTKSADVDMKQILDACRNATDIIHVLDSIISHKRLSGAAQEDTLMRLQEFYGMQRKYDDKGKSVYFLAPKQHIWVDLCSGHSAFDTGPDGMIQIDCIKAQKIIRSHVQGFLERWKEKDELQVCQLFRSRLCSFQFHKQLEDEGCVKKMLPYYPKLSDYLKLCCTGLQLSDFRNGEIKHSYVVRLVMNFFKPIVSLHIGVTKREFEWIAKSSLATILEQHLGKTLKKSDLDFHVDDWLEAWGILSILGKDCLGILLRQLDKRTKYANTLPMAEVPLVYVRDSQSGGYMHIISMWIRSCILIQSDKRVIASSKVVLRYFLEVIARRKSIRPTLSITNLVNILTIHTTALLSLTALCNFMQQKQSCVLLPSSYERVLNVFDNTGKQVSNDTIKVLDACMQNEKLLRAYDRQKTSQYAVQRIQSDITHLLWQILDILLGRHSHCHYFQPLKDALKSNDCVRRGETRHCLLLTLVLLGNLTEIDKQCTQSDIQTYHKCINDTFKHFKHSTDDESQVLQQAHTILSSALNSAGFFLAINHLIATADSHDHIAQFNIRQRPWRCELERTHISQYPKRQLLPIAAVNELSQPPMHGDHTEKPSISSQNIQVHSGNTSDHRETPAMSQQAIDLSLCSTVPSHPANAYMIKSVNQPEMGSISNPQQNMNTLNDSNFSPPTAPTQLLTSQTSVEPQEEGETVINIEDDEDLQNLALSAPFVLGQETSKSTAQQGQSATTVEDTSMVDEQFCRFCAVSLRADDILIPVAKQDEEQIPDDEHGDHEPTPEDQGEKVEIEPYALHCDSEKHINNMKAHETFIKLKKEFYEPSRVKLSEVLQNLKKFESENITSNLHTFVQEIEKELEKYERALNDIRSSAEWKIGASWIEQDMLGHMDALITAAENKLSSEKARVQREQLVQQQAANIQEEATDEENLSDEGEGSQSEEEIIKEVDASKTREKEREIKRSRKKRFKANRHSKSGKR